MVAIQLASLLTTLNLRSALLLEVTACLLDCCGVLAGFLEVTAVLLRL
jgi:hypothetical protein